MPNFDKSTDADLADYANNGLAGQGAVVESMTRLRLSNEKLTKRLVWLTVALVIFTVALLVEGALSLRR